MKTMMRLLIHTFHIACFIFAWTSLGLCIQLNPPKQLTVSEGKFEKKVRVEWVVLDEVDAYRVYRSWDFNGSYDVICEKTSATYFDDTEAESGVYYWYRVSSLKDGNESIPSTRIQGWRKPFMAAVDKSRWDMISRLAKLYPHFKNVKSDAIERQKQLPSPLEGYKRFVPSSDQIFEDVKDICSVPHRRIGSPEGLRAEKLIVNKLRAILDKKTNTGETNVFMEPVPCNVYNADNWELKIKFPDGKNVNYDAFYAVNTGITYRKPHGGLVNGAMVWAGEGTESDFKKLGDDLSGKIVVAQCRFPSLPLGLMEFFFTYYSSDPTNAFKPWTKYKLTFKRENLPPEYTDKRDETSVYWQAFNRGAEGLVLVLKDHPGKTNTHWGPYDGKMRSMPAMYVGNYHDEEIKQLAENGTQASITIEGTLTQGFGHNIYGILPGNGKSKERILISSHHDSPFLGALEDGTGVAMVLAMAKTWSQVDLEKRDREMLFVLTTGHHYAGIGAKTFAKKHSNGLLKDLVVNINLEHLAAKHYDDDGEGNMVWTGEQALNVIFVNEDTTAISVARRMIQNHQPEKTILTPSTLLGPVPPGESGHYHIHTGVDFIHWISSPYYLLTKEDTLEKVDQVLLNPLAMAVSEMIATYMAMPAEK
jgi:hypothetical protein